MIGSCGPIIGMALRGTQGHTNEKAGITCTETSEVEVEHAGRARGASRGRDRRPS